MKQFDIIFHKGNSLFSRLIRKITSSKEYSHCAFLLDDGFHLLQLDYKTPVSISHLTYKVNTYDIYELTFELTDDEKEQLLEYIRQRLNTAYDWKFIISRGFNFIFGTPIVNSKKTFNCDELIITAFRSVLAVDLLCGDLKMTPENLSKSKLLRKVK